MAIYFDMDGVLADFRTGVEQAGAAYVPVGTTDKQADDAMWAKIKAQPHFYRDLPEIPLGMALFRTIQAAGEEPEVLTAVPKPEHGMDHAGDDKKAWAAERLGPGTPVHICYRAEKIQRCHGPEDILFDDQERNIQEWRHAGGTGVLFREDQPVRLPPRLELKIRTAQADMGLSGPGPEPALEPSAV